MQTETYPEKLLRRTEVENITAQSRSTIYKKMEAGDFPQPIRIGGRSVRWRLADVQNWISRHAGGEVF